MIRKIETKGAPAAIGPYAQAVGFTIGSEEGNNEILFSSGQIPINPETGEISGEGIKEQALQVMKNLKAVLEADGKDFDNVVKTTCFLSSMDDFAAFNEVYGEYFVNHPARSCVAVKTLPKNVLCEVEVIAVSSK